MTDNLPRNTRRQDLRISEINENKENIQLIWLDGDISDSSDSLHTQSLLLELNPAAQFYSNFDRCFDLIKTTKDEKIFLIISGKFAQEILVQIHHYQNLVAIFVFCANRQYHESLLQTYKKIIEIFTDQKTLLYSIREKMNLIEKQSMAFSLFDQKQKSLKDLSKESASFLWHKMLIYVLRQMPQDEQSKKEMLNMCRNYYQNNKYELKKIQQFEQSHSRETSIEWYTDECFLYKLLNKALRTEDIELLYTFRFFIIDLCAAIEEESQNLKNRETLIVYRGTQIPKEDFQKLRENVGKVISTNGFLSTSRNMNISLKFACSNFVMANFESVLFEIKVDSKLKLVVYADVGNKSRTNGEEEVLFNINCLFKIHSVKFDSKLNLWKVQLIATDKGAEKVEEYLTLSKQEMEGYTPMIYFGRLLLYELGQVDRAGKYFNMLLKSLPFDHPDIASVYNNIGNVYNKKGELKLALENYEIAYEIRRQKLPPDHPHMAFSLYNIGDTYRRKGNFDEALSYFQKTLTIEERNHPADHFEKASILVNVGRVYADKGDFDTALNYLSHALTMYKRVLSNNHLSIATCLGTIGNVHEQKGNLSVALDYYDQQLKIEEQCLPYDHPDLSLHLDWIVDIYIKLNKKKKALQFCQEKLKIQRNRLDENHPCIAQTLISMARVEKDNNLDEALRYYNEALFILKTSTSPDLKLISDCLISMACLYTKYDMHEEALQCELEALELKRQILSSDHIDIANNLRNIGLSYVAMNNTSEALRYFNESIQIYKLNYGSEHEEVTNVANDIARLIQIETSKTIEDELHSDFTQSTTGVTNNKCLIQ